ncbi:ABC transporter substrate-binding protein [Shewanella sp. UCD-KL21]|uniref:ABC transporter substrate-binding protein n=1 Tax=Shewanella sp. UCD-KL21 TaxID=1917164 RepID=UPI000970684E|nr:ABC transporter substrate-binding protein [Shewanella sp. UCD-KL21]
MLKIVFLLLLFSYSLEILASPKLLKVYFDADRTGHIESSLAIEQGFKVAFDQADNKLGGLAVEFVSLDHRGNVGRSKKNMDRFLKDPNGIVFIGGLHSPPLIKYRDFINESQLLTLVPWAAGGPITRYPSKDNFVFRLSVDDKKVGKHLVDFAMQKQCKKPHMMLENTAWGKSNYRSMTSALEAYGMTGVGETWFAWGINPAQARLLLATAKKEQVDCLFMVAGATEGALIVTAVAELGLDISIYSHWGITGGNFATVVPFEIRNKANLHFIQSCFNFYSSEETDFNQQVFNDAKAMFPEQFVDKNIKSPTGFVHGYDLGKIFIAAANNVGFTDNIVTNRIAMKQALESISAPVDGLIKQYQTPFSVFSLSAPDAHEALDENDLCMAIYDDKNAVKLIEQ